MMKIYNKTLYTATDTLVSNNIISRGIKLNGKPCNYHFLSISETLFPSVNTCMG